jgi:hypothetical protein
MMSLAFLRKGWCPGALRPMQSGDGLLLRVRPRAGRFSIAEIIAITETAARCGSGEIDLTNRTNMQLRGGRRTWGGSLLSSQCPPPMRSWRGIGAKFLLKPPFVLAWICCLVAWREALQTTGQAQ